MNAFENMLYKALYEVMDQAWHQADDAGKAVAANESEALREAA